MTKRMTTMTGMMIRLSVDEWYVDGRPRVLSGRRLVAMLLEKPQDSDIAKPGLFSD